MAHTHDYTVGSSDWRRQISLNSRRTYFVIGSFILIYLAMGLVIDLFIQSTQYPYAPLSELLIALITLQLFPIATLITAGVAIVSLFVTYAMHNKLMLMGTDSRQITPETAKSLAEKQLYNVVEEMKVAAGMHYMPKVFIMNARYMNAFASGYSEKSAMVAITQGLLDKLDREELKAVMAHEVSHIRHMDIKVTMTASILSNLILMILDFFYFGALFGGRRGNGRGGNVLVIVIVVMRILLPIITMLLMFYLSRTREYMADAGCVELMRTNEPLARALIKINQDHSNNKEEYTAAYRQTPHEEVRRAAYLYDPKQAHIQAFASLTDLYSTHPSLKKRLAAIGIKLRQN